MAIETNDHGWTGYITDSFARLDSGEIDAEFARLVEPHLGAAPARILDVGTGPGHFLVALAQRFPKAELFGTDFDERHLTRARADLAGRGIRAELRVGDGAQLPFLDETFDLVICQAVMPYASDDRAFLDELTRVLRPGGLLWFASHGFGFYLVRIARRSGYEKLRYTASMVSGVVSMLSGYKPLGDTPVTVGWLERALDDAGLDVKATEWSRWRSLPKLIRTSAVKRC
jgi:SAM-dependent methyltransferase